MSKQCRTENLEPVKRCLLGQWYVTRSLGPTVIGRYAGSAARELRSHPLRFLALDRVPKARMYGFTWSYHERQANVFKHRGFLLYVEV